MVRRGTVVNGVIVPEGPPLPEGTQVVIDPGVIGPLTDETYEEHLAILRQSILEAQAGDHGEPAEVVFARLDEEIRAYAASLKR